MRGNPLQASLPPALYRQGHCSSHAWRAALEQGEVPLHLSCRRLATAGCRCRRRRPAGLKARVGIMFSCLASGSAAQRRTGLLHRVNKERWKILPSVPATLPCGTGMLNTNKVHYSTDWKRQQSDLQSTKLATNFTSGGAAYTSGSTCPRSWHRMEQYLALPVYPLSVRARVLRHKDGTYAATS